MQLWGLFSITQDLAKPRYQDRAGKRQLPSTDSVLVPLAMEGKDNWESAANWAAARGAHTLNFNLACDLIFKNATATEEGIT